MQTSANFVQCFRKESVYTTSTWVVCKDFMKHKYQRKKNFTVV